VSAQRGFAMIAILALVALIAAFLIASSLNRTAADVSNEREDRSMSALRKAKAALIAYAANEQWQAYKGQTTNQPGGLPCPDINDSGSSPGICSGVASRVGRLPWATIGSEDLRDASGERLWYSVSSNFYKNAANIINSDTPGLLNVTGAAPASNVVAVVFAPGEAISGQDRLTSHNDLAAYLEGYAAGANDYTFNSVAMPSATANDRLLVITQAELMAAVEPVVAARIERDVKPLLTEYFTAWGRYPFAVPFVSPPTAQSAYLGVSPQTRGLLPVTNAETFTWQNATVTQIGNFTGFYASTVSSASCSISSLTVTCTVNYDAPLGGDDHQARPIIKLEVFLSSNVNLAFANLSSPPTPPGNIPFVMRQGDGNLAQYSGPPWGYWSFSGPPPTTSFVGSTLTYTGWLHDAHQNDYQANITFPLPAVGYLPRLTNPSTTDPNIDWFIANQWYRQTYYAVAPDLVPNGGGNCATTPPCLTVNNLPGPNNNKQAILVFAGRALDGQNPHPTGNVGDYLEFENSTPADSIFEHRAGPSPTINDRVVVVAP
jgi:hypothetical protein